jgi:dimethylhistidine N-methyltransferase
MFAIAAESRAQREFASDVLMGIGGTGRKSLPSRYLYDDVGSALFEVITLLPEYGLTRADSRLLMTHSAAILESLAPDLLVVELGSGSGTKTRYLLEAARERNPGRTVRYIPIDISAAALTQCTRTLNAPGIETRPLEASYLEGLTEAVQCRHAGQAIVVLFLGSTIGNFAADEALDFLREIRRVLQPGDALLLGTDLVKPVEQMLDGYDDPIGATGAFNLNVLARINRELGGEFDLRTFRHEARWNRRHSRIEMHLRSKVEQQVRIGALDREISFREGETIWTESSYKFVPERIARMAWTAGFDCRQQWIDRDWPFAESLLVADL